jgi:hypothetical protein
VGEGRGRGGLLAAKEEGGVFREVADNRSLLPAYTAFTAERGARRQGGEASDDDDDGGGGVGRRGEARGRRR